MRVVQCYSLRLIKHLMSNETQILTKNTAMIEEIGMIAQNKATRRQDRNDPSENTMKMPEAEDMPLQAINMPLIEGSLHLSFETCNYCTYRDKVELANQIGYGLNCTENRRI